MRILWYLSLLYLTCRYLQESLFLLIDHLQLFLQRHDYLFTVLLSDLKFSPLFLLKIDLDWPYLGSFLCSGSYVRVNRDRFRTPILTL